MEDEIDEELSGSGSFITPLKEMILKNTERTTRNRPFSIFIPTYNKPDSNFINFISSSEKVSGNLIQDLQISANNGLVEQSSSVGLKRLTKYSVFLRPTPVFAEYNTPLSMMTVTINPESLDSSSFEEIFPNPWIENENAELSTVLAIQAAASTTGHDKLSSVVYSTPSVDTTLPAQSIIPPQWSNQVSSSQRIMSTLAQSDAGQRSQNTPLSLDAPIMDQILAETLGK